MEICYISCITCYSLPGSCTPERLGLSIDASLFDKHDTYKMYTILDQRFPFTRNGIISKLEFISGSNSERYYHQGGLKVKNKSSEPNLNILKCKRQDTISRCLNSSISSNLNYLQGLLLSQIVRTVSNL